ncbi:hypothetical protein K431DRAFT_285520 [Polychaeton citri CBS 116435]|uniref:Malate dehydrogenase n=1 Tax=Polychaeton citri CBS 116435 TaxID=1314669 RepID=A0A9P4UPU8_9PEZI|nr:hypothetical protein K431DRAFT_285520 [Polychaeton citri CBS 116435]
MAPTSKTLLGLSVLLASASCLPHNPRWSSHTPAIPLSEVDNSSNALPDPESLDYDLKYIALGLGTQNYSCANGASAPAAVGALARLFDATAYLSKHQKAVDSLSADYLKPYEEIFDNDKCSPYTKKNGDIAFPCQDGVNKYLDHLPKLGEHYFTAAGVPSFDLKDAQPPLFLAAKKVGSVAAPASAYAGSESEGAVAWLYLTDNGSGVSNGLKAVYRIETAGGSPPTTCAGQPESIIVPYAAEYWFFD